MKKIRTILISLILLISLSMNVALLYKTIHNQTCNNTIKMQGAMIKKKDIFSELENEYEEQCALANGVTVELIDVTQRFSESWKNEVAEYEMLIAEKLESENKDCFEEMQEKWSVYSEENNKMIWMIYEQAYGGGSYLNLLEAELAYQRYYDRARELKELYDILELAD